MYKITLLSLMTGAYVLGGCGVEYQDRRTKSNKPSNEAEIAALKEENAKLRAAAEESQAQQAQWSADKAQLVSELAAKESQLANNQADLDARVSEIGKAYRELQVAQSLVVEIEQQLAATSESNAELVSRLSVAKAEMAQISATIASQESEILVVKAERAEIEKLVIAARSEIASLQQKQATVESFLAPLLKPLQGLWFGELELGLTSNSLCKVYYQVAALQLHRATVCRSGEGTDLKIALEIGKFVDLVKVPTTHESGLNLEIHRQVMVSLSPSKCVESFPAATKTLSWSAGFDGSLDVNVEENGSSTVALIRGDAERGTENCEQILGRSNRPGLEEAVAACKVFAAESNQLPADPRIGCLSKSATGLAWSQIGGGVQ